MSDLDAATTTDDWSARATSTIVGYVDTVRAATTGKALVVSRLAVYFLAAGLIAITFFIILLLLMVRLGVSFTAEIGLVDDGEPYAAYWILGAILTIGGLFMWRKRGR